MSWPTGVAVGVGATVGVAVGVGDTVAVGVGVDAVGVASGIAAVGVGEVDGVVAAPQPERVAPSIAASAAANRSCRWRTWATAANMGVWETSASTAGYAPVVATKVLPALATFVARGRPWVPGLK